MTWPIPYMIYQMTFTCLAPTCIGTLHRGIIASPEMDLFLHNMVVDPVGVLEIARPDQMDHIVVPGVDKPDQNQKLMKKMTPLMEEVPDDVQEEG